MRVVSLARAARAWAEERSDAAESYSEDLCGWCAIASGQLHREFVRQDIPAEIHMWEQYPDGRGSCHVFLVVEDHIVDVTATQFTEFANEPVVILHRSKAYDYDFYRTTKVFVSANALRKHQKVSGWPQHQMAYGKYLDMIPA